MHKKTITGFVILLILFIFAKALGYFLVPLVTSVVPYREAVEIANLTKFIFTVQLIVSYLFNIGVGIFLVLEAKAIEFHRGLWFCLGVIFGFNALILFYLMKLLKGQKEKKSENTQY